MIDKTSMWACSVLVLALLLASGTAQGKGGKAPATVAQSTSPAPPRTRPVYKPPTRGAPTRRVGAGARGDDHGVPVLAQLAPDATGPTSRSSPPLY